MPVIPATRETEAEELLTWEVEVAVSLDHATALQPGQQCETWSQKEKEIYAQTKWLAHGTEGHKLRLIQVYQGTYQ